MSLHNVSLGLAHFSAINEPPDAFARLAAKAGFARIGLRLFAPFEGAPHYPLSSGSSEVRRLKAQCIDDGIEVYDIEALVIDHSFSLEDVKSTIEASAELGAKRISIAGDDQDFGRLVGNIQSLCALAADFELSVDLENMGWRSVATFANATQVIRACATENAGVLVDAIHFYRNGGETSELAGFEHLVRSVQLCDVKGPAPVTHVEMLHEARAGRFAPSEGELPLLDFVTTLGCEKTYSIEVPLSDNSICSKDHINHLMRSTLTLFAQLENAPKSKASQQ